jgi:RNA polymerase sigma-54 factor
LNISQGLNTQLSQKLVLSKEMLQAIELIQLPLLDLKERIDKELIENPALEVDERKPEMSSRERNIESIDKKVSEEANFSEGFSSFDTNKGSSLTSSNLDSKRQFLEGTISLKETLNDHLIWQLNSINLTEKEKRIGQTIISLINEDGFFKEEIENIFPDDIAVAKDMLETIQLFDPPGIGTRDVQEALIFQIESFPEDKIDQSAYIIVKKYFDLMIARKDNLIAKNLRISVEDLKKSFEFLSQFNPYPGRVYSSNEVKYIMPDAVIYRKKNSGSEEGELVVEINDDIIPHLTISGYMNKIAKEAKRKRMLPEQKKYIVEKVSQAKKFIDTLKHRKNSLFKLVLAIVKYQEDFFFKGPKYLKPLTMKSVAEEIGLSESTVSRLASSKYIQTEWGIHEIKFFFTNSISKGGESDQSAQSVREIIKEIIISEQDDKLTDQKIVDILKNRGINIARRTVSKYRKILNILPSHQRKL